MRYTLKLEAVGDNITQQLREIDRFECQIFGTEPTPIPGMSVWVARIKDTCSWYGFEREFIKGVKDYSLANSVRSRGILQF